MSKRTDELSAAREHLDQALDHHAEGRHAAVARRIALARGCIDRALDAEYVDPTAATGAQVSDGQSPRSIEARQMAARLFAPWRR